MMETVRKINGRQCRKAYLLFAGALAILFAVLFVRALFSMPLDDELCYLASLKRYLQGDRFLLDDWHPPTQLNTWPIFQIVRWIPDFEINVLQARIAYLCVHFVSGLIIWRLLKDKAGILWMVFVYLCFTPYNITALSYNTMSIASFFVLTAFCLSRRQWRRRDYLVSGALLCLSMFSNPYLFLVYPVYLAACVVMKCRKTGRGGLFSCRGILWVTCGALIPGGLFLISLIGKGSFGEYCYNIKMILNDAEHKANPLMKLLQSQWQVFRVYWRCSVPLIAAYAVTILKRKKLDQKWKAGLFCFSVVFTIYATLRFAFIYGSIANNLMMVPLFYLGVEIFLLTVCGTDETTHRMKTYFFALAFGYLFAVCNFLGTNTEILSMSAMFVIPSGITTLMLCEFCNCQRASKSGKKIDMQRVLSYGMVAVFAFCVFYLRLFFTWFDEPVWKLDTKMTEGPCRGIYTTAETAQNYQDFLSAINLCGITSKDKVLFLPISALPLMASDGKIAAPYVTRFAVDSTELAAYYDSHPHKLPEKVIITDCENGEYFGDEADTADYFLEMGYREQIVTDQVVMLVQ